MEPTCDGGEVYPHQQGEEAGDVGQDVAVGVGHGVVHSLHGLRRLIGHQVALLVVVPKQVVWRERERGTPQHENTEARAHTHGYIVKQAGRKCG